MDNAEGLQKERSLALTGACPLQGKSNVIYVGCTPHGFYEKQMHGFFAKIVTDSMNNYLLYEHLLQVKLVPLDRIHRRIWVGSRCESRRREEERQILKAVLRKEHKHRKKKKESGIDFEYPNIRTCLPPKPKKIKFLDL
ncbi:hypothetical protein KP509_33G004600 [Ceratopteris richardii]|uniref:Uncharacterized protein n=1 Tax=Ceratopteris richardii TaxID=49495 RepID=A0A8T2QNJ2_CERRI|nr:hypothetical protein KP509_33G004600 [Ceratopteris richardii]